MSEPQRYFAGDQVFKHTGDYRLHGEIRGAFRLWDGGPWRYVVRHQADGGGFFCHIYSGSNLRLAGEQPAWGTAPAFPSS